MIGKQNCPRCGASLPGGKWGEFCPKCLARVSLGPARWRRPANADASENLGNTSTRGGPIPSTSPLRRFGDYELLEEIARGGMGTVWRARQLSLDRMVALKLLRAAEFARPEDAERFRAEAAAVASLQHPHIVALHEFGEHQGQPWFSMDFIEGRTLAQLVRDQPLSPPHAAELLKTIAEAIAYAHARGILHRDIKPSNILLDQNGQPRVADFGLAKRFVVPPSGGPGAKPAEAGTASEPPEGGTPNPLTLSGQLLGTPNYAPPEQLAVHRGTLGPPSDVYALGAVLYEMLTGRPPFLAATIEATLLQVIDTEPVSPRLLNPAVPIDLETICLKCLEKEPTRRYATAQALVEELSRFLHGKPILARPIGVVGQLWRWCRRKPGWATAGALTHLLVVAVVLVTVVARIRLAEQAEVVRRNSYVSDIHLVAQAIEANNLAHATELLDKWRPGFVVPASAGSASNGSSAGRADRLKAGLQTDLRGFEWFYFDRLCQSDELLTVGSHANVVTSLAFSPDGRRLASGSFDGEVRVWELSLGDPERGIHSASADSTSDGRNKFRAPSRLLGLVRHASRINALAFSPDNRTLASGSADKSVRLWDAMTLREFGPPLPQTAEIAAVAFSTNSQHLAVASFETFTVWNLDTRTEISRQPIPAWQRAAISSDLNTLALGQADGSVTLWDAVSRSQLARLTGHTDIVLPVTFSADARWLAAGSFDNTVSVWDVASRRLLVKLTNHIASVSALAFSPDNTRLASVSYDQRVKLWDTTTWRELATFKGHRGAIWSVAFSPDNHYVATGGKDGTVRLWSAQPKPVEADSWMLAPGTWPIAISDNGLEVVARDPDGKVTWRKIDAWDEPTLVAQHSKGLIGFAKVPPAVVLAESENRLGFWDKAGRGRIAEVPVEYNLGDGIVFSNDGKLIVRSFEGRVRILNAASGEEVARIEDEDWLIPVFSPDDRILAVAKHTGPILLWEVSTKRELGRLRGHTLRADRLVFSQDGKRLASASEDGTVRLWDVATRRPVATLRAGVDAFWDVAFSPDMRRVAGGTGDGRIVLWDLITQQEVATLRVQPSGMVGVRFTPDGRTLVGIAPQTVARWRADTR